MEDCECAICKEPIEPSLRVTLGEKGSATINQASKDRKESLKCSVGQVVHVECRRKYCSPNSIVRALKLTAHKALATTSQQVLRSAEKQFNFRSDCFYCGKPAVLGRKRKISDVVPVKTVETRDTILDVCKERGDDWANAVQARILHVYDLHAADAVYHRACSTNFRTKKQIPVVRDFDPQDCLAKKLKLGRPTEKRDQMHSLKLPSF